MRAIVALVSLLALAAIVGSAGAVMTKDYPPRLAVSVEGVPGYVYYNRTYDLTIEYANHGGSLAGPVELAAELPETFALAEHIGDPRRHGERLVWTLDGLDSGERGSVTITVQGTLPDDLTDAVYDLPGYEGHTAFVEGFELGVTLTAGSQTASTLAVADTGASFSLTINKSCAGPSPAFDFDVLQTSVGPILVEEPAIACGQDALVGLNAAQIFEVTETAPPGWTFGPPVECSSSHPGVIFAQIANGVRITTPASTGTITCTFSNTRVTGDLAVQKLCGVSDTGAGFEIGVSGDGIDSGVTLDCDGEDSLVVPSEVVLTLSETQQAGYLPPAFGGNCAEGGTVTVGAGESATCTVINLRIPTLVINKTCVGGNGETFGFSLTPDGDPAGPHEVACGGSSGPIALEVGTQYSLQEVGPLPAGWSLTGLHCVVNDGNGTPSNGGIIFTPSPGGTVICTFTNTLGAGEPGDGGAPCPVCCPCGVDIDIDIDNTNNNLIGIFNDNTNNNANDNNNENENENKNANENNNVNTNTQNQENTQNQDNTNEQTNNIDSSPEVNISGLSSPDKKPAPKPSAGSASISPPSTGDAGLADGSFSPAVGALALLVATAGGMSILAVRSGRSRG